jgi:hypothetical protein
MEDIDRKQRAEYLESMITSPGGKILFEHIDEAIKEGWQEFIKLPVSQKTSKMAFNYQARYEALKGLVEWVKDEIRVGKDLA